MYELLSTMSMKPPIPGNHPVVLMLHITIPVEGRENLIGFLREALPYYQEPGGIRVRLLSSVEKPEEHIEMIEYETQEAYLRDQHRVTQDVKMRGYLDQWHRVLDGHVIAKPYFDLSSAIFRG